MMSTFAKFLVMMFHASLMTLSIYGLIVKPENVGFGLAGVFFNFIAAMWWMHRTVKTDGD